MLFTYSSPEGTGICQDICWLTQLEKMSNFITELLRVEGTSKDHLDQTPAQARTNYCNSL